MAHMRLPLSVAALLAALAVRAVTAQLASRGGSPASVCPTSCEYGSYVMGVFSPSAPPFYSQRIGCGAMAPSWDRDFKDPKGSCWRICSGKGAAYWEYRQRDYFPSKEGVCYCYGKDSCAASDRFTQCGESEQRRTRGSVSFVGKICSSSGVGDPHFTGADGSRFDFSGIPNRPFALISDAHLAVNALFGGRWAEWMGETKALTWMRQVAVLWGEHSLVLEARAGPDAEYGSRGYMAHIRVDGAEVAALRPGEVRVECGGQVALRWAAAGQRSGGEAVDVFEVRVGDLIALRVTARPEIPLMRTPEDGVVHFTVEVTSARLSRDVHGILGQTYRPDFSGRLEKQELEWSELLQQRVVPGDNAEGFIDGGVHDYATTALTASDCRLCRFLPGSPVPADAQLMLAAGTGSATGGGAPAVAQLLGASSAPSASSSPAASTALTAPRKALITTVV